MSTSTTNPAAPVPGAGDGGAATDPTAGRPDTWASADRGQLIDRAEVVVTSPNRNFVTLKLTTADGVTGSGTRR